jgi:pimeloyl-ACP methyl ester carboxylesterase
VTAFYPYRSAVAKETYRSFYDSRSAKEWPIHSENRMVATSFGQTFVRISGPDGAPPLVLLPGMTATSLLWTPNIRAFSETYRTFAIDPIGDVGRSECSRPLRCLSDHIVWLDELFNELGLGDAVNMVGLSHGGWLTCQFALSFPKRVHKMVLLAPAATVQPFSLEFLIRGTLGATRRRYFVRAVVHWLFADLVLQDPIRAEAAVDGMLTTFQCMQLRRVITPTVLKDHELRSLRIPTLFIVGENEKIYAARKAVLRLQKVAPQIMAEIIPGAGHDFNLVQANMVNRKVLDFLALR